MVFQAWIELDLEKSQGPLKVQCADCGAAVPSGSGRRIVVVDIVTEFGFVQGADLVYQGDLVYF